MSTKKHIQKKKGEGPNIEPHRTPMLISKNRN